MSKVFPRTPRIIMTEFVPDWDDPGFVERRMTPGQTHYAPFGVGQPHQTPVPKVDKKIYILIFTGDSKEDFKILGVFTSAEEVQRTKAIVVKTGVDEQLLRIYEELMSCSAGL